MDISTNTTLVGGTHSNTPLYISGTDIQLSLGAGWTKGMFVYAVATAGASFTVVAGTAALEVPTGTSAASSTALAGIVGLECVADGSLRAVQPAVAAAATVPGAPTAVTLGTATSTTQPMTFTAPASNGGSPLTGYRVGYRIAGSGDAYDYLATGSTTTGYVVTGLTASTAYEYVVDAVNSVGAGADSSPVNGSTAAAAPALRFLSALNRYPNSAVAAGASTRTKWAARVKVIVGSDNFADARIRLSGIYQSAAAGDTNVPNAYTVTAAYLERETGGALSVQALWGGSASVTVNPGTVEVLSDALLPAAFGAAEFVRGHVYWIRLDGTVPSGGSIPANLAGGATGAVSIIYDPVTCGVSAASATGAIAYSAGSGGTGPSGYNFALSFPAIVVGTPKTSAGRYVSLVGDSIVSNVGDTATNGIVAATRALFEADGVSNPIAGCNFGYSGTRAQLWTDTAPTATKDLLKYSNILVEEFGTNGAQFANSQAIWGMGAAAGNKIIRTKLLTITTSTDTWATKANQTKVAGWTSPSGAQIVFNGQCAAAVGSGVDAFVDYDAAVLDATDRDYWKSPGFTVDGTHPTAVAYAAMSAPLRAAILAVAL